MKTFARTDSKTEILRRVRTVQPASARQWGQMSAHQMICHLADACRMAHGAKPVADVSTWSQRTLVKWIALYLPLRWPPGLLTRPEIDQLNAGTRPGDFAADLAELVTLLDGITAERSRTWPVHPIFGRMSQAAWLRWAYLHADHHLRQFGA